MTDLAITTLPLIPLNIDQMKNLLVHIVCIASAFATTEIKLLNRRNGLTTEDSAQIRIGRYGGTNRSLVNYGDGDSITPTAKLRARYFYTNEPEMEPKLLPRGAGCSRPIGKKPREGSIGDCPSSSPIREPVSPVTSGLGRASSSQSLTEERSLAGSSEHASPGRSLKHEKPTANALRRTTYSTSPRKDTKMTTSSKTASKRPSRASLGQSPSGMAMTKISPEELAILKGKHVMGSPLGRDTVVKKVPTVEQDGPLHKLMEENQHEIGKALLDNQSKRIASAQANSFEAFARHTDWTKRRKDLGRQFQHALPETLLEQAVLSESITDARDQKEHFLEETLKQHGKVHQALQTQHKLLRSGFRPEPLEGKAEQLSSAPDPGRKPQFAHWYNNRRSDAAWDRQRANVMNDDDPLRKFG